MKWIKPLGVFVGWILAGVTILGIFVGMLWLTGGIWEGYPALFVSIAASGGFGIWITSVEQPVWKKGLKCTPITLALLVMFWAMIPLGPDQVFEYPPLEGEERWDLGDGRVVSMTHHLPVDSVDLKEEAILFIHGGPGAYVRDFDREFMAGFTDFGYEVFVYDQVGAGRSAILNIEDYSHQLNVDDMTAIINRMDKPVILFGNRTARG